MASISQYQFRNAQKHRCAELPSRRQTIFRGSSTCLLPLRSVHPRRYLRSRSHGRCSTVRDLCQRGSPGGAFLRCWPLRHAGWAVRCPVGKGASRASRGANPPSQSCVCCASSGSHRGEAGRVGSLLSLAGRRNVLAATADRLRGCVVDARGLTDRRALELGIKGRGTGRDGNTQPVPGCAVDFLGYRSG